MNSKQRRTVKAVKNADWQQVVFNGGPPCFHLEGERFCLRAQRWAGHGGDGFKPQHQFVSFEEFYSQSFTKG